MEDKRT